MSLLQRINRLGLPVLVYAILVGFHCGTDSDTSMSPVYINPFPSSHKDEARTDILDGLVAHWTFQETLGTSLVDSSANSLHGEIEGAQWIVDDGHAALSFDGEDDYVKMALKDSNKITHLAQLGEGSLSIWFKLNSLPQGKRIFPIFYYGSETACNFFDAANEGLIVEVGHHPVQWESERLYFTLWANGCTYPSFCFDSNHAIEAGQWYHFVVVIGPDYNTGYLNGQEMIARRYNFGSRGESQFFENAVTHEVIWLGRGYWDSDMNYFDGLIGEIRIYEDPISAGAVKTLYANGTP